jgi:hypothetical protein
MPQQQHHQQQQRRQLAHRNGLMSGCRRLVSSSRGSSSGGSGSIGGAGVGVGPGAGSTIMLLHTQVVRPAILEVPQQQTERI